jgi:hypothetical protein
MVSKTERTLRASIVFGDDGASVLSAFKTVLTEVRDDDGVLLSSTRRDVDLTPSEVSTLFGATIDAHLTQTNAAKAAAEASVQAEIAAHAAAIAEKDAELAAKQAERDAIAAELAWLQSEVEPA